MPEGPLGFNRPFGIGPFVEEETQDPQELLNDIRRRGHSYRNYEPEEFLLLAESDLSLRDIRPVFRMIEDGRFNQMLKEAIDFWYPLDNDEQEIFAQRNSGLMQWLEVYTTLEEIRKPSEDIDNI